MKNKVPLEKANHTWMLGGRWVAILCLVMILAVFLIWTSPSLSAAWIDLSKVTSRVEPAMWPKVVGIVLIGLVLTHLAAYFSMRGLGVLLRLQDINETEADHWSPVVAGVAENLLYVISLVFGKSEFIGAWLLVKVASQWGRWQAPTERKVKGSEASNEPRRRYNRFLYGNALSILGALGTYAALKLWALK